VSCSTYCKALSTRHLISKRYHNTARSNMKHLLRYWGLQINFSSASRTRYNTSSSIHECYRLFCLWHAIWILKGHSVKPTQSAPPSNVKKNLVPKFSHIHYPLHMFFAYKGFSPTKNGKFAKQQISSPVNTSPYQTIEQFPTHSIYCQHRVTTLCSQFRGINVNGHFHQGSEVQTTSC
jgi:hypothetical protein